VQPVVRMSRVQRAVPAGARSGPGYRHAAASVAAALGLGPGTARPAVSEPAVVEESAWSVAMSGAVPLASLALAEPARFAAPVLKRAEDRARGSHAVFKLNRIADGLQHCRRARL
jgi:hypothetical protein